MTMHSAMVRVNDNDVDNGHRNHNKDKHNDNAPVLERNALSRPVYYVSHS